MESQSKVSILEIFDDLTLLDNSVDVEMGCIKAFKVFGQQPSGIWKILLDNAKLNQNTTVADFCAYQLSKVNNFATVPKWVGNYPYLYEDNTEEKTRTSRRKLPYDFQVPIPEVEVPKIDIMTEEEMTRNFEEDMKKAHISGDEMKIQTLNFIQKTLGSSLSIKNIAMKEYFFYINLLKLEDNEDLFRVLGPAHPFIFSDYEGLEYGGPRMFIANNFDYNEDFHYYKDWFTGSCDKCFRRIRRRWHAVRKPLRYGGWKGEFCSWDCVLDSLLEEDFMVKYFVDHLKTKMNDIGIQDRLPNPILKVKSTLDPDDNVSVMTREEFLNLRREFNIMLKDVVENGECVI